MDELVSRVASDYLKLVRHRDMYVGAACPFHKGGEERRPSFWVSKKDGSWGCFTCGEYGKSLKALLKKLGVWSIRLERELNEEEEELRQEQEHLQIFAKSTRKEFGSFEGEHKLPEALLGVYDWCPTSLVKAGFEKETLREHDIGYDRRNKRITFPIRDVYGNLIGISGRATGDGYPKYKVYTGKRVNEKGEVYDLGELGESFPEYSSDNIRDHLWRANMVFHPIYHGYAPEELQYLIVVEGYKAALWMVQCGWYNTVAVMGSYMTSQQERLIRMMGVPTWVLLDNNEAGHKGADKICGRLGNSTFEVYRGYYLDHHDESIQPDDCSPAELETILKRSLRCGGKLWRSKERT